MLEELEDGSKDLLISGRAICSLIEMSDEYKEETLALVDCLLTCKGLVVFRASPAEKAKLVELIRTNRPEITTLAIGDGANDVNMI